jgi:hypothetical protein
VPAGNHQIRCWRGARGNPSRWARSVEDGHGQQPQPRPRHLARSPGIDLASRVIGRHPLLDPKVLALVLMGVIFLVAAAVNLVLGP